jgi:hypothetical protein
MMDEFLQSLLDRASGDTVTIRTCMGSSMKVGVERLRGVLAARRSIAARGLEIVQLRAGAGQSHEPRRTGRPDINRLG